MKFPFGNNLKSIVTGFLVAMLFSCEGNLNEVRELTLPADAPQAVGKGISLVYTDEGRVVATLKSDLMLDFSNKDFPYREFPQGVEVQIFDEQNRKNTVTANYAVVYEPTGLIDMQGDVVIITSDSTRLTAEQLYWDQNLEWIFTDHPNTIQFKNGTTNKGQGFDSNQEFSNFRSRSNVGVQVIQEEENDEAI